MGPALLCYHVPPLFCGKENKGLGLTAFSVSSKPNTDRVDRKHNVAINFSCSLFHNKEIFNVA